MNLSALHQYLIVKDGVNKLVLLFEKLNGELFKESFTLDGFLTTETSFELTHAILNLLEENKINKSDRDGLQSFFTQIQEQISTLPVIHLMLAFYPKDKTIRAIHDWFYDNYKKTVLLDITVDRTLIGGSVVSFKGRANDYSLKNRIEQMQASD
ncbi:MAG TPA: F0F1 ATP synthase subunit delta [Xanthomonadales bacterium]|nr:F0F1 ATP synthase subunit delta [Xanthomonadales bacterium]